MIHFFWNQTLFFVEISKTQFQWCMLFFWQKSWRIFLFFWIIKFWQEWSHVACASLSLAPSLSVSPTITIINIPITLFTLTNYFLSFVFQWNLSRIIIFLIKKSNPILILMFWCFLLFLFFVFYFLLSFILCIVVIIWNWILLLFCRKLLLWL